MRLPARSSIRWDESHSVSVCGLTGLSRSIPRLPGDRYTPEEVIAGIRACCRVATRGGVLPRDVVAAHQPGKLVRRDVESAKKVARVYVEWTSSNKCAIRMAS